MTTRLKAYKPAAPKPMIGIGLAPKTGELFGDLEGLQAAEVVSLDIETTGLKWGCRLIGLSMAWRLQGQMKSLYLSFSEQRDLFGTGYDQQVTELMQLIKNKVVPLHTQGFDVRHLFYNLGAAILPNNIVDVAVMSSMVGAQEDRKLATLFEKYVEQVPDFVMALKEDRGTLWLKAPSTQAPYARWDAEATLLLFERFHRMLSVNRVQQELLDRDIAFTRLVNRMMTDGLPVDRQEVERRSALFAVEMDKIKQAMRTQGVYMNPNSDVQVLQYINQQPGYAHIQSTEAGVLAELEGLVPFISEVIRYRQYSKAIGSWFKDLLAYSAADGRFHAQLNPFGTRSFRMSSSDFNAQAIPMKERTGKDGKVRAFGAMTGIFKSERPDDILWSFDLKQAEVRWSCVLSGDNALAALFADRSNDVYTSMSLRMWETTKRRQDAKRATLAAIYETGYKTFAITNGLDFEYARDILDTFRTAFPQLRSASRRYESIVKKTGNIQTFDGRRRWFTEEEETYKGFNQLVQTSVSEYMQLLMLAVDQAFPGRLLLQVHDSLVMYAPRDKEQRLEMHRKVEELANSVIPESLLCSTTPAMRFLVDSESWESDDKD